MLIFCQNIFDNTCCLCYIKAMEIDILKKAGLTDSQAKGYLALIEHGALTPTELADKTGESRTNGYAIAEKLISLGLAFKNSNVKTTIEALNPTKIRSIINEKQQQLKAVSDEISAAMPTMLSKFRLTSDQPGVISSEGPESLRLAYNEIIASKDEVLIFPGRDLRKNPEISALIDVQIERQRKAGIKSLALMPASKFNPAIKSDGFLTVKKLPEGVEFEAQIMIFGNNVITTVANHGIVNTIISSPEVASAMRSIFFALWDKC